MSTKKVLIITPEEKKSIRKSYGRTDNEIDEDVETIKIWLQKQPHLPQNEDPHRIRMMLIFNKFSLEKTKNKLDMYYSIKHLVPEIFENREPSNSMMSTMMKDLLLMPLPRLTPEHHRVYVFRFMSEDSSTFTMLCYLRLCFGTFDLRMMEDLCLGDHFVVDFALAKLGHLVQFTPSIIKKAFTLLEKAYSDRIKGVHFVNLPPAGNTVVAIMNTVMSEKLANRVFVHKTYESLHKVIPKDILPLEYKGKAGKMLDLYANWKQYYLSKNDWIKETGIKRSDESKRIGTPIDSELFGMCGSFRKLNVD